MRLLIRFIRLIPKWFKLYRDYEYEPKDFEFMMDQYIKVISSLTYGRMSKPMYYANDIIAEVINCFCDGCEKNTEA